MKHLVALTILLASCSDVHQNMQTMEPPIVLISKGSCDALPPVSVLQDALGHTISLSGSQAMHINATYLVGDTVQP